jgi:hexosaminidase
LWTEQADEVALDSRLWPRLSALGERMWSDPATTWREAETRMLIHRARLVENGIAADRLQPEWCFQNENQCPWDQL